MGKRKVALNEIVGRMSDPRAEGRKSQVDLNETTESGQVDEVGIRGGEYSRAGHVSKVLMRMQDVEVMARQAKEHLKAFSAGRERAGKQFKREFQDLTREVKELERIVAYLSDVEGDLPSMREAVGRISEMYGDDELDPEAVEWLREIKKQVEIALRNPTEAGTGRPLAIIYAKVDQLQRLYP